MRTTAGRRPTSGEDEMQLETQRHLSTQSRKTTFSHSLSPYSGHSAHYKLAADVRIATKGAERS